MVAASGVGLQSFTYPALVNTNLRMTNTKPCKFSWLVCKDAITKVPATLLTCCTWFVFYVAEGLATLFFF